MTTIMVGCNTTPDDSVDVVRSKANVLKIAVRVTPPQPIDVKWWKSVCFVDKFLTAGIAAGIFAQQCLYGAGDDLSLGMTTQLHAFQQCDHV
ncbi:hypothetical protein TNCV_56491 [Trichonephila clavipes]|nr:hypothetical protein TNCV_56491 [Trichonephila clavipes]